MEGVRPARPRQAPTTQLRPPPAREAQPRALTRCWCTRCPERSKAPPRCSSRCSEAAELNALPQPKGASWVQKAQDRPAPARVHPHRLLACAQSRGLGMAGSMNKTEARPPWIAPESYGRRSRSRFLRPRATSARRKKCSRPVWSFPGLRGIRRGPSSRAAGAFGGRGFRRGPLVLTGLDLRFFTADRLALGPGRGASTIP